MEPRLKVCNIKDDNFAFLADLITNVTLETARAQIVNFTEWSRPEANGFTEK